MSILRRPLIAGGSKLLQTTKAFLFDCDGVIWKGNQPIAGSIETLNYLKKIGKLVFYVTNNSTKSREEVLRKLQHFGVNSSLDEILTSSYATAQYLTTQPDHGEVYVVGEEGIFEELEAVGIKCHGREDNEEHDISALEHMNTNVRTVVVGLDRSINYIKLSRAGSYIRDFGCTFIATNTDASFPYPGGVIAGGSGCIVSAIETICGKKPDCIVGKPNRSFIDIIRLHYPHIQISDMLMVGDRLDTDIVFARRNGISSLLVFSGITSESDMKACDDQLAPHFCTNSLHDVLPLLSSSC